MIATDLSVMGGCFAQEKGETVETYWPAREAVFSDRVATANLLLLRLSVFDGDSANDVVMLKGRFASVSTASNWQIAVGLNRVETGQNNGRINILISTNPWGVHAAYGAGSAPVFTGAPGAVDVTMRVDKGRAYVKKNGESVITRDATYTLTHSDFRVFYLRSMLTETICGFHYRNNRTGVCLDVQALQSPAGMFALYCNRGETLIEV